MVRLPDNMLTFGIGIVYTLSTVMRVECIPELISSEPPYAARTWMDAHATFHGGSAVADTMGKIVRMLLLRTPIEASPHTES